METKRRQLGWKNYRLFILLTLIVAVVTALFLFVVNLVSENSEKYSVASGSTVLDKDYSLITLESDAQLSRNFFGDYVLATSDTSEKINLGKNAVVYSDSDYMFYLYGTSYLVNDDMSVKKIDKYEEISKNASAFYKLDDRKYLIADKNIQSKEISLETSGYLIVELDRQGDATLVNNKLNLKTINPIIIQGTYYDFDVTHEKLLLTNGDEVDLVSVIGTSNEHKDPEVETEPEEEKTSSEISIQESETTPTLDPSIAVPSTSQSTNSQSAYYDDYIKRIATSFNNLYGSTKRASGTVDTLTRRNSVAIDFSRWTNVTGITPYPTYAVINYSVFDPNNEYSQIFIEVSEASTPEKTTRYALSKENTSYIIQNLSPNKKYIIDYGYTLAKVVDEDQANIISDSITIYTPNPEMSIKITKITAGKVYYTLYLDKAYIISNATIKFINGGQTTTSSYIQSSVKDAKFEGSFDYTSLHDGAEIRVENIEYNGVELEGKKLTCIYRNN